MTFVRGFGVAGTLHHAIVAELAQAAEQEGYSTFWVNDTPTGDGLAALEAAQHVTTTLQLGVGVIPVDRKPAPAIASHMLELGLNENRLIIGIGSGGLKSGAPEVVRAATLELQATTKARVVVGALGPRMLSIGGAAANGVLLNWIVPASIPKSAGIVKDAARTARRPEPWIAAYVRVALSGRAEERLRDESERYAGYPAYAAHFARMKVSAIETCVVGLPNTVNAGLNEYMSNVDEVVVRAITAEETLDAYLSVLQAASPRGETA